MTFGELLKEFLAKVNLPLTSLFNGAEVFSSESKVFSNLNDTGMSLPAFPSRTNVKLHNIPRIARLIKKVITNLNSSKASGLDCIPVVVLKNCDPELSYILAELFNMCLKEYCFQDFWKVSFVVPVFKNVGKRSTVKHYRLDSIFSVVSKVFEKLVNNWLVDHLENCGLFSDSQYDFRSSRSIANLLIVISDRIITAFNRSGATQAVALDIYKAFDRVWHAGHHLSCQHCLQENFSLDSFYEVCFSCSCSLSL